MTDIRFELPEINTWRLFNKAVSQRLVVDMVEAWEAHGYRFGCVCIDDGWTVDGKLGDWEPDPQRFPDLAGLVEWIHARGYAVRLWVAPIQFHAGTKVAARAFPDCALKNVDNEPAFYTGLGTYRIDPRTAVGQAHIRDTMQRLVRDYDVDAFKVDFPPFYFPDDEFYREHRFAFPEHDKQTMVQEFYRLVRESIDAVNPRVRVECARDLPNCQPYINDTICGDLVGHDRNWAMYVEIAERLRKFTQGTEITPWLEMAWGEGSDAPTPRVEWYAGILEYIAASINLELKLEHSFQPFAYPNAAQIRCLTNLYGPRNRRYKVLHAGRKSITVQDMLDAGVQVGPDTRFLAAPEEPLTITLHTAALGTNALAWRARNVLTDAGVDLRARNEFWGGSLDACRVSFEAEARQVYEFWHEGTPDPYFRELFLAHQGNRH
ncbi:MAG: alpha-galactosidase [Armatimonadota bacterium]